MTVSVLKQNRPLPCRESEMRKVEAQKNVISKYCVMMVQRSSNKLEEAVDGIRCQFTARVPIK
jgi:hypothetical protein